MLISLKEKKKLFLTLLALTIVIIWTSLVVVSDSAIQQSNHCDINQTETLASYDLSWFTETTCSIKSFKRGPHQRIIGFSFYGDSNSEHHKAKNYLDGIRQNLRLMEKYYPGYIMRLYVDFPSNDAIWTTICSIAEENSQSLDLCFVKKLPGTPIKNAEKMFPMNWRFLPTLDYQVDIFLSRDLDSRINKREFAAVSEWLEESEKSFHMMRDHPEHDTPFLGAAWGTRLISGDVRKRWKESWKEAKSDVWMWMARNVTGPDQAFLRRYVWPWAKYDSLQHDSYTCKHYSGTKGFPVKRENKTNNFVASVVEANMFLNEKCPEKCRRNKEWEYC